MKRIHYAGGEFVTSDELAVELIEYAAELADRGAAASVEVPAVLGDGSVEQVLMLLGPTSQMMAVNEPTEPVDMSEALGRIHQERTDAAEARSRYRSSSEWMSYVDQF